MWDDEAKAEQGAKEFCENSCVNVVSFVFVFLSFVFLSLNFCLSPSVLCGKALQCME